MRESAKRRKPRTRPKIRYEARMIGHRRWRATRRRKGSDLQTAQRAIVARRQDTQDTQEEQCLGALSLDWSKFFDSLERDVGNSLVQYMLGRDSNALGYVQAERTFTELSKARVKVGRAVQTQGKRRGNGFLQGPCYSIEVALMMMSVWSRALETEADVQTTGFVDDSAVRSKRGKTRDQSYDEFEASMV